MGAIFTALIISFLFIVFILGTTFTLEIDRDPDYLEEAWLQIIAPHPHLFQLAYGAEVLQDKDWKSKSAWGVFYTEKGHSKYAPVFVVGQDISVICGHVRSGGCLQMVNNHLSVVVRDPNEHADKGCYTLVHEWYHLMGYSEQDIPKCKPFDNLDSWRK